MNIKNTLVNARRFLRRVCGMKYVTNVCQHKTSGSAKVTSFDVTYRMTVPLADNGNPDYCPECIANMAIKCAWCGSVILVGDPLTLYIQSEDRRLTEHERSYAHGGKTCLVGCLSWDCAQSGADRQGFWDPPGKVRRVLSPMEMILASMENGGNPEAVIISDLSDPYDLGTLIPTK